MTVRGVGRKGEKGKGVFSHSPSPGQTVPAEAECRGVLLSRLLANFPKRAVVPTPLHVRVFQCSQPSSKFGPGSISHFWCTITERSKQALLCTGLLQLVIRA